jgi:class 3 adenylate cyclase
MSIAPPPIRSLRSIGGRIVKTTSDAVLIEFPSVVGAVQCADALQTLMAERRRMI